MNKSLFKEIQDFVSNEVAEWTRSFENENKYPEGLVDAMKSSGLFGMNIPQKYGGLELPASDIAQIIANISEGSVSLCSIFGSHLKVCNFIRDFGTKEQREELLPLLAKGAMIAAFAYTEEMGKSVADIATTLTQSGMSGVKPFVTNALNADLFAVVAKLNDIPVLVLIKKDVPGLHIGADIPRLGLKNISVCKISFENCPVDISKDIIGSAELNAANIMESTKIADLTNYTARAMGLGREMVKEVVEYAKTKKSGSVVLADIPLLKKRLAEIADILNSCQVIFDDLIKQDEKSLLNACIAKVKITEDVVKIAQMSLKIYGGNGYTSNYPIERHLRDAIGLTIIGTPTDILLSKILEMNPGFSLN